MPADRFVSAERLFRLAIGVEPASRDAFVRDRAGADESLVREVLSLLAEDVDAGALDRPILDRAPFAAGAAGAAGNWPSGFAGSEARADRDAELPEIPGFRVLRCIGAGGMGIVYEAEQLSPRRPVAVKVMRSAAPGGSSWRRFALEAHVLARFQHPGIAQIFGTGTFDAPGGARPFLAMELVHGEPLTECGAVRALPAEQKLELLAAICDALQHAHQRGVIHRDLKPANILVTVDESDSSTAPASTRGIGSSSAPLRPKILDFGVACAVDDAFEGQTAGTIDGQLVGTLPYMSPEQVATPSSDVDTRSDIYALGVIAYELLAGRHPYELRAPGALGPLEAARIIREVDPPRLGRIDDPSVEAALRSTIGRCYRRLGLLDEAAPHLVAALTLHRRLAGDDHLDTIEAMNALAKLQTLQGRDDVAIAGFREVLAARRRVLGEAHPSTIVSYDNLARELRGARRLEEAVPLHERAYALATLHLAPDDPGRLLVSAGLASLRRDQGRLDEAEPLYREALTRSRAIHGSASQHTLRLMNSLALLEMRRMRHAAGESLLLEAIAVAEVRVGRDHPNTLTYLSNLGGLYLEWGRLDDAERLLAESAAAHESILGPTHRGTLLTMTHLARVLERRGDEAGAAALRERIADRWIERDGPGSPEAAALRGGG